MAGLAAGAAHAAGVPQVSHVKAHSVSPTRETVTYQQGGAASWDYLLIAGPGAINGHRGWVDGAAGTNTAYYQGLEAGRGYTVTITPVAARYSTRPVPGSRAGRVFFTTSSPAVLTRSAAVLAGHRLVRVFSPAVLAHPPWSAPSNAPGNCPHLNGSAHVNAAGYAEIDTTGAAGDCVSLQSPGTLPTRPGYVYEARVNFSSFHDWPALWMYGPNWPAQGEIDAVEGGPGTSYVTWHQAGGNPDFTIGPDSWDKQTVPYAGIAHDIRPGAWTTVDIAFTTAGVDVYYNGHLYVHVPESVTVRGSDPMYLAVSEGSCVGEGQDVCNGGSSPAGSVQVAWVREFS